MTGADLPSLPSPVPGACSTAWVDRLAARECPAITARRARRARESGVPQDPIVWARARGANVEDVDGNVYVDLTAGFGVAAVGHAHPAVTRAVSRQVEVLPHAMGDAFADPTRVELMEALCARTGMDRVILGLSGSDAIDAAMKTVVIARGARGRPLRVLCLAGGYHGLGSGALPSLGYLRAAMQAPFAPALSLYADVVPFDTPLPSLSAYDAVILEPVQGRGGMRELGEARLGEIHAAARGQGALVIHDEIYSGCGRTGAFLSTPLAPDLLCLGKALGGGFPVSACLGTARVMDAWGNSGGAAIHTQTFLGHPVGNAAALATLPEIDALLPEVRRKGEALARACATVPGVRRVTGRGLMLGVHVDESLVVTRRLLERGYIVLPCGEKAEALGLTPPFVIADAQLAAFVAALGDCLR
ncbi:MAG: aspartate aminotransferase family protein [Deltaproteobacteria bacterium]|nr:aspartate aminotransferase family protein [Deltaproteobacteria bacterium]